jgi:hypothetical protein
MPQAHRAQMAEWSPARFTAWAGSIGPNTLAVIEHILSSKKVVEQTYRSALGVLSLAKKPGGTQRLEDTCAIALAQSPAPSYSLVRRLWPHWEPTPPAKTSLGDAGFVRGAAYYAEIGGEQ